jgi:hypothetical protein
MKNFKATAIETLEWIMNIILAVIYIGGGIFVIKLFFF